MKAPSWHCSNLITTGGLSLSLSPFLSNDSLLCLLCPFCLCCVCVPLCSTRSLFFWSWPPSWLFFSLYFSAPCFLHLVECFALCSCLSAALHCVFFRGRQMKRRLLLLLLMLMVLSFQSSSIFLSILSLFLFLPSTFHWEHHVWRAHRQEHNTSSSHFELIIGHWTRRIIATENEFAHWRMLRCCCCCCC